MKSLVELPTASPRNDDDDDVRMPPPTVEGSSAHRQRRRSLRRRPHHRGPPWTAAFVVVCALGGARAATTDAEPTFQVWEDYAVEPLAQLPEPGTATSIEAFLESHTRPAAVNDTAWWAYQMEVFALCRPLWDLVPPHKRLADYDFYEAWRARMPRFGRFIYVALPWHHVVEQHGMLRKDYAPLRVAARIFGMLDFAKYDHFITLGQASFPQIHKYCRRGGFPFKNLDKLKIVFTSRLENLDRLTAGTRLARHEIPIPLLYEKSNETPSSGPASKQAVAFFAGSCTCPMRERLGPLRDATGYDMSGVHACGAKIPRTKYLRYLRFATWVLTPRGSFPAAYMISEAIQSGSLPVYIYDWKYNATRPLPPAELVQRHLPFVNMGVDWQRLGAVVTGTDIPRIPEILSRLDAAPRLAHVDYLRPLFTIDGTFRYILATLSLLAEKDGAASGGAAPLGIRRMLVSSSGDRQQLEEVDDGLLKPR